MASMAALQLGLKIANRVDGRWDLLSLVKSAGVREAVGDRDRRALGGLERLEIASEPLRLFDGVSS